MNFFLAIAVRPKDSQPKRFRELAAGIYELEFPTHYEVTVFKTYNAAKSWLEELTDRAMHKLVDEGRIGLGDIVEGAEILQALDASDESWLDAETGMKSVRIGTNISLAIGHYEKLEELKDYTVVSDHRDCTIAHCNGIKDEAKNV